MSDWFAELDHPLREAMASDRHRLRQQIRRIEQLRRERKPIDKLQAEHQAALQKSITRRQQRLLNVPRPTFDADLPITAKVDEIKQLLAEEQVLIVCGETGSGKSTQLPKICLAAGLGVDGVIGHTQPRRMAARSVASRVASELGVPLGGPVGFKVRFTDVTEAGTYIKLMTDGILLAETQSDRFLSQYDALIIDEAHERSLNIEFLLGYLHRLLLKRRDLKVIITSATIDAKRFSEHFASTSGPAPIVEVSGRMYPVEVRYRPLEADDEGSEPDWLRGVLGAIDEAARIDSGDVLVFLPTERDILETAKHLRSRSLPGDVIDRKTEILPLYSRLSTADQDRVFGSHPFRRIVLATNVAESSLTVPGIRFVVDLGTARISRYSPRSKVQRLPIESISRASADQRKGRCGRVGPGICFRLYDEADFLGRDEYNVPEIQRTNLAAVILQTKALELGDLADFPFLDPPKNEAIRDGYKLLFELGALTAERELTEVGRQLFRLPVDPRIGRMMLAAHDEGCLADVLVIASVLELQDPRDRPVDKQQQADQAHAQFADPESDFLSLLKLWDAYQEQKSSRTRNQLRKWCRDNFLSYNRMREWVDLYHQLSRMTTEAGWKLHERKHDRGAIHRALLTGLLSYIGNREQLDPVGKHAGKTRGGPGERRRAEGEQYTLAGGLKAVLWPGSGLASSKPSWVMAAELVETTRRFLRTAAQIDPAWIERLAKHLVNRSHSEPHWSREAACVFAFEKVSLGGLTIVPRRRVRYGHVDPAMSRHLFIQHALVEGDYLSESQVLKQNRDLLTELERLQTRLRRPGLVQGEEARFAFYDARLPADVFDGPRFENWRRDAERSQPDVLRMRTEDLLAEPLGTVDAQAFPDVLVMRHMQLPVEYRFEPGHPDDGMTLTVPEAGVPQLDSVRIGWLVPGLLEEKVGALIRSLPKHLRRNLVPVQETVEKVLSQLVYGQGSLETRLAELCTELAGERVTAADFDQSTLPNHLRLNLRVIDADGKVVTMGRDLGSIRQTSHQRSGGTGTAGTASGPGAAASSARDVRGSATTASGDRPSVIDGLTLGRPVNDRKGRSRAEQGRTETGRGTEADRAAHKMADRAQGGAGTAPAGAGRTTAHGKAAARGASGSGTSGASPATSKVAGGAGTGLASAAAPSGQAQPGDGSTLPAQWHRDTLLNWDFGELPASISYVQHRIVLAAFPAVADLGETAGLRLFDTAARAAREHRHGVRRLFSLAQRKRLKAQVDWWPNVNRLQLCASTLPGPRDMRVWLAELIADRALFPTEVVLPRTAAAFATLCDAACQRIGAATQELLDTLPPLFEAYQQANLALNKSTDLPFPQTLNDVHSQHQQLIVPGFLVSTPWPWLQQFARYFQAQRIRLDKLRGGKTDFERRQLALVEPLWRQYLAHKTWLDSQGLVDAQLDAYHWMLEEYRVSLFAQELGTAITISSKRLEKQWELVPR